MWGEQARVRRLVGDLRGHLPRCLEANRGYASEGLPRRHLEALGVAYVRAAPLDGLLSIAGIELETLETIRRAGLLRIGDLVDADLLKVLPKLGWKRVRAIERHVRTQLADARGRAETWRPNTPVPFPRHPEVEAAYQGFRHAVEVRRHRLEQDVREQAELERQIGVTGPVGRRAWLGAAPDPERFGEQRLQFVMLRMARSAGLKPPDVRVVGGPDPRVERWGRALRVHRDVAAVVDEAQLYSLGAHALFTGRRRLPVGRVALWALGALAATWARVRHEVVVLEDRVYRVPRAGVTSAGVLLACVPLLALTVPLLVTDVALRAVVGVWRRPWVFRADRKAMDVVGARDHLADALRAMDALVGPGHRECHDRPGDRVRRVLATPGESARRWWIRVTRRLGLGEPSTAARIRALEKPAAAVADVGWSLLQVAVLAGVGLLAWGRVPTIELPDWTQPAVAVEAEPAEVLRVASKRGCHVRAAPKFDATSRGVVASGAACEETADAPGKWRAVRCGEREGFMHGDCLPR